MKNRTAFDANDKNAPMVHIAKLRSGSISAGKPFDNRSALGSSLGKQTQTAVKGLLQCGRNQ
jgi:hypothetical protein